MPLLFPDNLNDIEVGRINSECEGKNDKARGLGCKNVTRHSINLKTSENLSLATFQEDIYKLRGGDEILFPR